MQQKLVYIMVRYLKKGTLVDFLHKFIKILLNFPMLKRKIMNEVVGRREVA